MTQMPCLALPRGPVGWSLRAICAQLAWLSASPGEALASEADPQGGAAQDASDLSALSDLSGQPGTLPIIVFGNRALAASLGDVTAEQVYEDDRLAGYGASTVGELIGLIREESGEGEPAILINGEPAASASGIADLPVEALARIEVLPRGTASRIGGAAGQRAYNVVLRRSVKSATFAASRQLATDGAWGTTRAEAQLTYIKGRERINFSIRASDSDNLLEADRGVSRLTQTFAYAPLGNIIPRSGSEVDPALSALAGQPVSVVALPRSTSALTLASLLAGINRPNDGQLGQNRTLRGAARSLDLSLTGNKTLAPWLSLSVNARLGWYRNKGLSGLPSARFVIPADSAFTPFSTAVQLALSDAARPLANTSLNTNGSVAMTFHASFGKWTASLLGRFDSRERSGDSQLTGAVPGGVFTLDAATNPFDLSLAALIPVQLRTTQSRTTTGQVAFDIEGPVFGVPAGPVRLRGGMGVTWSGLDASDATSGARQLRRRELAGKVGLTIPLTGKDPDFLPWLGKAEFVAEAGRIDLGKFGRLDEYALALNWSPRPWLRIVASQTQDGRATPPELLAAPSTVIDNVPYFDPLTGETPSVTLTSGGVGNLLNEMQRNRSLALTVLPWPKFNLQFNAEYLIARLVNPIGILPPPSSAVVLAFPDRYVRDGNGRLTGVDNRTVNFDSQKSRQLRLGLGFAVPLSPPEPAARPGAARRPGTTLQINASHTILLESRTVIRKGLDAIDLLDGGAIGIGGGQQRRAADVSAALMRRGTGLRVNASWRGKSELRIGTAASPDMLTFAPLLRIDLKAMAELGALFPGNPVTRGMRLTIGVDNIANRRQRVTNGQGQVPSGYQPALRDPVGRTVMIELRKVF